MHQAESRSLDIDAAFRAGGHDHIDVGHSRLAYFRFGRGPDLVFVHGWPLHSATFRKILPALAREFTCHLIDLPGAGRTESDPDPPIGMAEHAMTVRAAVDRLGLERYGFVAHDSGGGIARLTAADDPRVFAMLLGNTEIPGHHPALIAALRVALRAPGVVPLLGEALRSRTLRQSRLLFGECFSDPAYVEGDFYDLFVRPLLASPKGLRSQLRLIEHLDWAPIDALHERHANISAPVLLVWGTDDPSFPLAKARTMLKQFGGAATLCEIPRAKLFAHEDHPHAFVDAALPFLRAAARTVEVARAQQADA